MIDCPCHGKPRVTEVSIYETEWDPNGVNKSKLRLAIVGMASAALIFSGSATATADTQEFTSISPTDTPIVSPDEQPNPAEVAHAEEIAESLVSATSYGKTTSFDYEEAVANGVEPQVASDYAAVLGASSDLVTAGNELAPTETAAAAAACTGESRYVGYTFWGFQWALNSCQTSQLIAAVGLGAGGIGTVTAMLAASTTVPPVAAVAAAVVTLGGAFLATCQAFSSNGGIYLNSGNLSAPTCWGQ